MFNLVFAGVDVFRESVFLRVIASETHREAVTHGQVNGALKRRAIPLTQIDVQVAITTADLGFVGVDAKGAANRVTSKQETLRASQDLCAVDVVKAGDDRAISSFIKVVFEKCRGRVATDSEILGSHAADADGIDVRILRVAAHSRCIGDQVFDVIQIGRGNKISGQRRNREWHVHHTLLPLGGSHDNFFERLCYAKAACAYSCRYGEW